jgi:uncharacterized protein YprB with RNaseH-like and TPR domain
MATAADKFSRLAALRPAPRLGATYSTTLRSPEAEDKLSHVLGAGIASNRYGEHLSIRNWFSSPEFAEASSVTLGLLSRTSNRGKNSVDPALSKRTMTALADPQKWLFLDTETTGLAGGTGTYAFLVGLAWWDAGGLQSEQLLIRDFSEEHSMLLELAERIAERPVLVTFNGKTFDWPLLESRFTMTRAIAKPKLAAHLDLLHPSRAIWRLRLGSVRLIELERHVLDAPRLGWHREEDVLSAMIPQYYFDYLRGGPATPLIGVVRHNQMDLRGLAALVSKIDELLTAEHPSEQDFDSTDLFGVSRFLHRKGDCARAQAACAHAVTRGLPTDLKPQARRDLAQFAKRRGDHAEAATIWHELAADPTADPADTIQACEQLAIHYERRAKDFSQAIDFTRLALNKLKRQPIHLRDSHGTTKIIRCEQRLRKRLTRLTQRKNRRLPMQPLLAKSE